MVRGLPKTVLLIVSSLLYNSRCDETLEIVSRDEWGARTPKERVHTSPAVVVIIHHTYIPKACFNRSQCIQAMQDIQIFHMDTRGWSDIAYNFAIGEDAVYEGRGWEILGAHTLGHNNNSLGVAFIGDYTEKVPSDRMLAMSQELIAYGISQRHIEPNYQLSGHRQFRNMTECPGDALFAVIQTWSHWTAQPSGGNTTNTTNSTTTSGERITVPTVVLTAFSLSLILLTLVTFDLNYFLSN